MYILKMEYSESQFNREEWKVPINERAWSARPASGDFVRVISNP